MKIKVQKYDPSVDSAPHYVEGEVEYRDKMTGLEALVEFSETIEHVNYDFGCASRLCGRCAMMLDGEPALVCVSPIDDKSHTFEPLKGFPVIRDLIVDKSSLDAKLSAVFNRVRIEPFDAETIVPAEYDPETKNSIYPLEFCCRCGVCNAGCPALEAYPDEFIGPSGMLAIAYRYLDPLDQGDRVMEAVSNGLYRCIQCGTCDTVCEQQDIDHLGMWSMLRAAAEERRIKPSYAK
ncbi:MAG: 2Fe-2S iron-sulfur cluster-binding protein [Raoultibacter sp.]